MPVRLDRIQPAEALEDLCVPELLQRLSDLGALRILAADELRCRVAAALHPLLPDPQLLHETFKLPPKQLQATHTRTNPQWHPQQRTLHQVSTEH